MRNAPSVQYPVGRCRFYAGLLGGLGLLALAVLLYGWSWLPAPSPSGPLIRTTYAALGITLWLGWAAFAWASWRRAPVGCLHWDAQTGVLSRTGVWRWRTATHDDGVALLQVALVLDLQSRALLCLRWPDTARRWVWVEASRDPARSSDLRRALRAAQT